MSKFSRKRALEHIHDDKEAAAAEAIELRINLLHRAYKTPKPISASLVTYKIEKELHTRVSRARTGIPNPTNRSFWVCEGCLLMWKNSLDFFSRKDIYMQATDLCDHCIKDITDGVTFFIKPLMDQEIAKHLTELPYFHCLGCGNYDVIEYYEYLISLNPQSILILAQNLSFSCIKCFIRSDEHGDVRIRHKLPHSDNIKPIKLE